MSGVPRDFHRLLRELGEVHDAELAESNLRACHLSKDDWVAAHDKGVEPPPWSLRASPGDPLVSLAEVAVRGSAPKVPWNSSQDPLNESQGTVARSGNESQEPAVRTSSVSFLSEDLLNESPALAARNSQASFLSQDAFGVLNESPETLMPSSSQTSQAAFELYREWLEGVEAAVGSQPTSRSELACAFASSKIVLDGSSVIVEEGTRYIPIHPNSRLRGCWEAISVVLLCTDVVMLPLQVFDVSPPIMYSMFPLCFWSLDIIMSLLTGFHRAGDGQLERRFRKIALRYLKTWFLFDLLVVGSDWASTALILATNGQDEDSGLLRIAKSMRLGRNLRASRLLRIIKLKELFARCLESLCTQSMALVFELVLSMTSFAVLSHFVACAWFYVGTRGRARGWVQEHGLQSSDVLTRYAYSIHWSVCQFTPASMEVFPASTAERVFSVAVILLAMMIFSSFLSSIASGMTQLRMLRSKKTQQLYALRNFFRENRIPRDLSVRISSYIGKAIRRQRRFTGIQDVQLLSLISSALKLALHKELFSPFLSRHLLFNELMALSPDSVQAFFDDVQQFQVYAAHDILFKLGDNASQMHFVVRGVVQYRLPKISRFHGKVALLSRGAWLSEAALWVPWRHQNIAKMAEDGEVALMRTRSFMKVATKHPDIHNLAQGRARTFLQLLSKESNMHDAPFELLASCSAAQQSVRQGMRQSVRQSVRLTVRTDTPCRFMDSAS